MQTSEVMNISPVIRPAYVMVLVLHHLLLLRDSTSLPSSKVSERETILAANGVPALSKD